MCKTVADKQILDLIVELKSSIKKITELENSIKAIKTDAEARINETVAKLENSIGISEIQSAADTLSIGRPLNSFSTNTLHGEPITVNSSDIWL
jgi:hypothetical protein